MGHKTQLHLGETLDSQSTGIYECFIYDQDDKGFCIVSGKTSECQELIKKKDLIITAVNVMPIVKRILTVLSSESVGDFVYNIRERAAEDLKCPENSWNHPRVKAWGKACAMIRPVLEKLEGIE